MKPPLMNKIFAYSIFFLILVAGCSAEGPLFTKAVLQYPASSIIYIYRSDSECLESEKMEFLIDSNHIVSLKNNEYSFVYVDPGDHLVTSGEIKDEEVPPLMIKIKTDEGKSHYVRYKLTCKGKYVILTQTIKLYLGEVKEGKALSEIIKTRLATIPNQEVSKKE